MLNEVAGMRRLELLTSTCQDFNVTQLKGPGVARDILADRVFMRVRRFTEQKRLVESAY
jgi:hypothetical protein